MKKIMLLCLSVLAFLSCQKDVGIENNTLQNLNFDTQSIDSNIGVYKGVFTTLDSEKRATVNIIMTDVTTFATIYGNKATAQLTFEDGTIVTATATKSIEIGETIVDLGFASTELSFLFSVESDGSNPTITNVVYNNRPSDILIAKHTTRDPVVPILGTFVCTVCNSHPNVNNTNEQTFNINITNPGAPTSEIQTQAIVSGVIFSGIGEQNMVVDNGDGTSTAQISGGFTSATGTGVNWTGTHTFSNIGGVVENCSVASGTWSWITINFGTLTGTFESNNNACASAPIELLNLNFTGSLGNGFAPNPSDGKFDSNSIIANVNSTTALDFTYGETTTSGVYSRGTSGANVAGSAGIYALSDATGNVFIGFQANDNRFTPGTIEVRVLNNTGAALSSFDIAYDIYTNNDRNRSYNLNFSYATDNINFTNVAALDYTSPGSSDALGFVSTPRSSTINVTVADGEYLYLRYSGDDVSAANSGSRDEIGIDNIIVTGHN